ncbi:RelE/ParE toxin domain-containing protein [Desulfonema limicola]|uniref:RelE/ParE toxin domain-containing protein n=1 Tax=Desulfonema limicola TaxID=45656 RepID=A0A975B9D0_9BACT|nr:type II toxin-antitoxin system RelE/ParE family toxin [Desulfonema limicola]QTA81081.1 RelE/ParE toxin domain-containing protein [Desulfonema limicola]
MYKDEYHPQVKKDLKKLDIKLRRLIEAEYIPEILSAPQKGDPLVGDLRDIRSYHLKTVAVLMIGKRGEFYKLLKRRIKR